MTSERIVLWGDLKEVYNVDAWFEHMYAGYIGMQSGNLQHLFVAGGDNNSEVIFERTIQDDDMFKRKSFNRTNYLDVYSRMTRFSPNRRYWVFDRDRIKLSTVKDTIYRVQGTDRVRNQVLSKLKSVQLKFDEELL